MRQKTVPIKSWVEIETAFRDVMSLPSDYPRMILVHGEPGLGKTTAVDRLHLKNNGIYLEASSTWTPRVILEEIAGRIGVPVRSRMRTPDILRAVLDYAEGNDLSMIVIDEFDRIAHKKQLIELVRELYDKTHIPLVMVGMGTIEATLRETPQFIDRIGQIVHFKAVDLEDGMNIAKALCEIDLTDDLIKTIWKRCGGTIRRMVTEFARAEAFAQREGIESVGVSDMEAL